MLENLARRQIGVVICNYAIHYKVVVQGNLKFLFLELSLLGLIFTGIISWKLVSILLVIKIDAPCFMKFFYSRISIIKIVVTFPQSFLDVFWELIWLDIFLILLVHLTIINER